MLKQYLIITISLVLLSCGGTDESTTSNHEQYYIEFTKSGELIDDDKCSYAGGHNQITFSIGKKAKIRVDDLFPELKENDVNSLVGNSYPAEISYNDKSISGEFRLDKVAKDEGNDKYGQLFFVSGVFISDSGEKVNYCVSLYNLNDSKFN